MINQIEIESTSRQNVTHTLWMDEHGKAIGCSCEARHYNANKACRHMNEWNTTQEIQAQDQAFAESQEQYKAEKAQREAEQYEKRIAYKEQQRKDEERTRYNNYLLSIGA